MRVLVTGATGKVGHAIVRDLLGRGDDVKALVRDRERALATLPAGAEPMLGDVTAPESLPPAVDGCELVFNAMGIPEQWLPDTDTFDRVNAQGSGDLARAARAAGVRRFVHTSTNDVFHADTGESFDESRLADYPKGTAYERSKQRAEELVLGERDGMEVVVLNPTGVYGPGPSPSHTLEKGMFEPLVKGRLPMLPPGGLGLVYVDGVAEGHLLAAEKGADGERYILNDGYMEFKPLAQLVVQTAGRGRVPPKMPTPVARVLATAGEGVSRVIRRPPMISRGQVHFFNWQAKAKADKAERELGWRRTALSDGIRETLAEMDLLDNTR